MRFDLKSKTAELGMQEAAELGELKALMARLQGEMKYAVEGAYGSTNDMFDMTDEFNENIGDFWGPIESELGG